MIDWLVIAGDGDVFESIAANRRLIVDAEVREVALIAQACDEWRVDESAAGQACERLISGGADGTAMVGEFLALELAGLLRVSPVSAALKVADVLNLRDRHPEMWAAVHGGFVEPWKAFQITRACATGGLSGEAARWVDHQLSIAAGAMPWGRAAKLVAGLIVKADPALAAERALLQRDRRMVSIGEHREGGSELFARLDTEDALALESCIRSLAEALCSAGSAEPLDHRRATALGLLADPPAAAALLAGEGLSSRSKRKATVMVHVAADVVEYDGEGDHERGGVARIEGVGPIDTSTLKRFLGAAEVVVRPVVDLNTIPPVDAYEIPERMREVVLMRNPIEAFPFSVKRAVVCDLDHTVPYDHLAPPGSRQTAAENLGPLSRKVHRAKSAGGWRVIQEEPGCFLWTSPHGFRYLVTPDGTTTLGRRQTLDEQLRERELVL